MEFVESEEFSVNHATDEQSKAFNVNRYSNDSGVVDIDLRPLEITEIHKLSVDGNGRPRPHSVHNSIASTYSTCDHKLYLQFKTAQNIVTCVVYSKFYYCNLLDCNLPKYYVSNFKWLFYIIYVVRSFKWLIVNK